MLRKTIGVLFVTVLCSFTLPVEPSARKTPPQKSPLRTIIIDAGHGGNDFGASGKYSYEKDIALAIALKLERLMKEELPDVKIVMTRSTDVFDHPRIKAQKANDAKGDLFLCIHVNSAPKIRHQEKIGTHKAVYYVGRGKKKKKKYRIEPTYRVWYTPNPAHGTETYVWAQDRSDEKSEFILESGENYENEEVKGVDLPDPNSPEAKMAADIWVAKYFKKSLKLANLVEKEFGASGRVSKGVKQRNNKGIWVLQATAMPSILVETGFISNPEEENYLNSQNGQNEVVQGILRAVKQYKSDLETQYIPANDTGKTSQSNNKPALNIKLF
jgi:N-acetylmuramoyl-L-alanine amidase